MITEKQQMMITLERRLEFYKREKRKALEKWQNDLLFE